MTDQRRTLHALSQLPHSSHWVCSARPHPPLSPPLLAHGVEPRLAHPPALGRIVSGDRKDVLGVDAPVHSSRCVKKRCSQVEDVLGVDAPVRLGTAALVARPRHVAELLRRRLVAVHWVGDALEAAALLALIPQGVALAHRASPTELEPASAYVSNTPT